MDNKIEINLKTLNNIFNKEAQKLVGKCMKRFELSDNKDDIKKQVKEILYEGLRDIQDIIEACSGKEGLRLTKGEEN